MYCNGKPYVPLSLISPLSPKSCGEAERDPDVDHNAMEFRKDNIPRYVPGKPANLEETIMGSLGPLDLGEAIRRAIAARP
jgi:hypothetical protein